MTKLRAVVLVAFTVTVLFLLSCGPAERPLAPKTQTWAELRAVRGAVTVAPPGESDRALYPRERLADGAVVSVPPDGLAWLRRDGGATLLVRGPAKLKVKYDEFEVEQGRIFVDAPGDATTVIESKQGVLHLVRVRASLEITKDASTEAYVLAGEVRTDSGAHAEAGERIVLKGAGKDMKAETVPAVAWEDWTGGLATTDRAAQPPPFGIGTVGARRPGNQGAPRFPLAIQRMDLRVTIEGDLALTEVDEVFFNTASEKVEGIYTFRTPEDASMTRFGVDRDGVVVWGRVKEKAAAAAQYQANVYEGSTEDPALLEWDAPGVYRARLYPIGPGETRRVVVRYAQWLDRSGQRGERRLYVFPMAAEGTDSSLPHIEFFGASFDLLKAGAREVRTGMRGVHQGSNVIVRAHDLVPRADLAVELFDEGTTLTRAYRATHSPDLDVLPPSARSDAKAKAKDEKDYVLVPIRAADIPRVAGGLDLVIVIDTSAATDTASLSIARATVGAVLAHMGGDDRAVVWAGDATLRAVAPGWTGMRKVDEELRRTAATALATIERGGATDLGAMLAQAAAQLDPARRGAVVYIGDGKPTVGELALADLRDRLNKLARPVRIFSVGVGDGADMGILSGVARGGFAERVGDGASAARTALRLLEVAERPAWLGVTVDLGTGVERVYPRDLSTLVADETVLVVGRVAGKLPLQITVKTPAGPQVLKLEARTIADRGDLRSRWAMGRLRQMLDDGDGRAALVDLGMRYGVITPVTSLYVPTRREMTPEEQEELERRKKRERSERMEDLEPNRLAQGPISPFALAGCSKRSKYEQRETEQVAESRADNKEGGTGTRAKGEEGSMGNPSAPGANKRYGVAGPADNSDPHMSRSAALREAQEFGMIGLLNTGAGGDPNAPTSPWGKDDSLGADPTSARGNTWGDSIGNSFGAGGLGLSGVGEGGGGKGEGLGLGSIGTLGHGAGTGTGQGFGSGHGRLGGAHRATPPQVKMVAPTITGGGLPTEIVQRIVRQNFGRFRLCYENGLKNNPNLQGRVSTRFIIDASGVVQSVTNGGSDLPDPNVVQCVIKAYAGLSFPAPDSGQAITVVVPISFAPEGGTDVDRAAAPAPQAPRPAATNVRIVVAIDGLPHFPTACSGAASLSYEERVTLWRERLSKVTGNDKGVALEYTKAIAACEAPTWRERAKLLSMMLDALPTVPSRVALWKSFVRVPAVADALYRDMLARVHTANDMRELHKALGLKFLDRGTLDKLLKDAKDPAARVVKLRKLQVEWPDDLSLAITLLEALEDAQDDGGAREVARKLRSRPDADAHVRTEVGELYLRLAKRAKSKELAAIDEAEARRTFGEIVEFSPDEPVARRRLGDLLRAHGWFDEARRQYETLARLSPDDPSVQLLIAATSEGLGKLEEAVRWAEKASETGSPGDGRGMSTTSRAMASLFLAWGRNAAAKENKGEEVKALRIRAGRLVDKEGGTKAAARVLLSWSHPELHPALWSNARGSMMPAPDGDALMGISQVMLPTQRAQIEVRMEPDEAEHAARLGAQAVLTVIFREGEDDEKIVRLPVEFVRGGPAAIKFAVADKEVRP
ncbi:MAG: AgmX/PglI C-terminal domain-containing protein [Deltaproteobacteria bacterium]|nr:AgmX/PglI C-terminal domain-containing protein [Deltaproteobacteria bacterium]